MPLSPDVPVRRLEAAAYTIPTETAEGDGTLAWNSTTLVVVEATAGAATGLGYTYADKSCVPLITGKLAPVVCGRDAPDVPATREAMRREIRNLGRPGLVSCALSAVETALWDLAARLANLPLCRLLGRAVDEVPVYGSGGFTTFDDEQLRAQLRGWLDAGFPRVKIKIGESRGTDVDRDLSRIALTRKEIGDSTELYVDANGGYTAGQAIRVGRAMAEHDVRWFEEPVSSDDLPGLRRVRDALDLDVAAGEYGYDLVYFHRMLAAGSVDCLQVDATRCGGYSEWLRAAALAAARNLEVSGHCAPNLTAHVAAATPNLRHLEWFADHDRIERMLFDGTLDPTGGTVHPDLTLSGHGLRFRRSDAERYRVA
jgi:L-alanine-DL-glutamate epimerase-like enolase superfamily enzyme